MKRIAARDRHIPANAVKVGLLAFAVLIAAQVSGWSVLDTLFFVLVGVLLIAYIWSKLSLRSLSISRDTRTDRAQVGQTLEERFRVENTGRTAKLWLLHLAGASERSQSGDPSPAETALRLARAHPLHSAWKVHDRPPDAAWRRSLRSFPRRACHSASNRLACLPCYG